MAALSPEATAGWEGVQGALAAPGGWRTDRYRWRRTEKLPSPSLLTRLVARAIQAPEAWVTPFSAFCPSPGSRCPWSSLQGWNRSCCQTAGEEPTLDPVAPTGVPSLLRRGVPCVEPYVRRRERALCPHRASRRLSRQP